MLLMRHSAMISGSIRAVMISKMFTHRKTNTRSVDSITVIDYDAPEKVSFTFKVLLMLGTAGMSWREQECEFQRPESGESHPTSSAFSCTAAIRISEMAYPDLPVESVIRVPHKHM